MKQYSSAVLGWVALILVVAMLACSGATPTPLSQAPGGQPAAYSGDHPVGAAASQFAFHVTSFA